MRNIKQIYKIESNIPIPSEAYDRKFGAFASINNKFITMSSTLGITERHAEISLNEDKTIFTIVLTNSISTNSRMITTHSGNNTKILTIGKSAKNLLVDDLNETLKIQMLTDDCNPKGNRVLTFDFSPLHDINVKRFTPISFSRLPKSTRLEIKNMFNTFNVEEFTIIENNHSNIYGYIRQMRSKYKKQGKTFSTHLINDNNQLKIVRIK